MSYMLTENARAHVIAAARSREHIIPFKTRQWIREIPGLAVLAACTNRRVALHIMQTVRSNLICPYHHERDKSGRYYDGMPKTRKVAKSGKFVKAKFVVTGTPHRRRVNSGKAGVAVFGRRPKYFHCGCEEDHVLADFYWWKTGSLTSPTTGQTEGWETQRLDPRARALVFNQWKESLALKSIDEEIYSGARWNPRLAAEADVRVLDAKIARLEAQREMLTSREVTPAPETKKKAVPKRARSPVTAQEKDVKRRKGQSNGDE